MTADPLVRSGHKDFLAPQFHRDQPVEVPPGRQWDRMSHREKWTAVRHALRAGRSRAGLCADHGVRNKTNAWSTVRRYWREAEADELRLRAFEAHAAGAATGGASGAIGIMDLREGCCRWPLWDDGVVRAPGPREGLYCGDAAEPDATVPYCSAHAHLARRAVQPPEVAARLAARAKVALRVVGEPT